MCQHHEGFDPRPVRLAPSAHAPVAPTAACRPEPVAMGEFDAGNSAANIACASFLIVLRSNRRPYRAP